MAEIIDFTAKRKKKEQPSPSVSLEDLAQEAVEGLLSDWERMARKNKLNEFFIAALPSLIDQKTSQNFMKDLNAIADLENNIGLAVVISAPGTLNASQIGWVVQFNVGDIIVATPDMAAEGYARCFGVLAYITIRYNAQTIGLIK